MPAWAPPLLAAGSAILLLNLALVAQRLRQRYGGWAIRLALELRRWDGRLPHELEGDVAGQTRAPT
jgi:hypothetical protein